MSEIRRARQYETDQIEMSPGSWMASLTTASTEAVGHMLHNILNPEIPAGPPYTHVVTDAPSITCPRCGMTSFNENDVEQGYCGNCHDWTTPR